MRKNNLTTTFVAVILITLSVVFVSCKKSYVIPEDTLPNEIKEKIEQYMTIYEGNTPPSLHDCWFVSSPNNQIHSSYDPSQDGNQSYDRYVGCYDSIFYWMQHQDSIFIYDNWVYDTAVLQSAKPTILGNGNDFSIYFTKERKVNSYNIKQLVIYSGTLEENVGIRNYRCAYIYTETNDSPDFPPSGSYEVFGDGDGLAEVNEWTLSKSSEFETCLEGRNIIEPSFSYRK